MTNPASTAADRGPDLVEPASTVSGHADPEGEAPWAMQLVVRTEKGAAPTHTAVCEAAARAVVLLLADQRAQPGGEWADAVDRWLDGRIRKVVRRARTSRWEEVSHAAAVVVVHRGAEVCVFVPGPTDQVPHALARLQVSGLALDDAALPPAPEAAGPVLHVALTPHVALTTGKAAAQCAHAAQLASAALAPQEQGAWVAAGAPLTLATLSPEAWREQRKRAVITITDAGFTEIPPGTDTAIAWW